MPNEPSSIVRFWSELRKPLHLPSRQSEVWVHPADVDLFALNEKHSFNLDYPPPAYVGDIDSACCVVLMANGGYDPKMTPGEFVAPKSYYDYLHRLHYPATVDPAAVSPYYARANFAGYIRDGVVAIANAVAYRSRKISDEPENQSFMKRLPSYGAHQSWLRDELLPAAQGGKRYVVVKAPKVWGIGKSDYSANVESARIFTGPNVPKDVLKKIARYRQSPRGHTDRSS